jgi:hypothetical protein
MIPSGLTSAVIHRARLDDGYVRVRDSGLITAVAQFLADEAAPLDEWLALFHPEAAHYLIPSPHELLLPRLVVRQHRGAHRPARRGGLRPDVPPRGPGHAPRAPRPALP